MNKFLETLYNAWLVLSHPGCWVTITEYSEEWDTGLNTLLDRYTFEDSNTEEDRTSTYSLHPQYIAKLGPVSVTVGCRPFSCFRPEGIHVVPKRSTMVKASILYDAYLSNYKKPSKLSKILDTIE